MTTTKIVLAKDVGRGLIVSSIDGKLAIKLSNDPGNLIDYGTDGGLIAIFNKFGNGLGLDVDGKLALADSGVTAGTYGTASKIPSVTIDETGRVTSASEIALSTANIGGLATVAATGSYNDLINKPTNVSTFANDAGYQQTSAKNVANGYCGLDGSGKVASARLPSYVDDVVEVADYSALPLTGETGKIYVTLADVTVGTTLYKANTQYRWSGSTYVALVSSPGSTDSLPEGSLNLYYTAARVKADQAQADWNQVDDTQPDFIRNKPTTPRIYGKLYLQSANTPYTSTSMINKVFVPFDTVAWNVGGAIVTTGSNASVVPLFTGKYKVKARFASVGNINGVACGVTVNGVARDSSPALSTMLWGADYSNTLHLEAGDTLRFYFACGAITDTYSTLASLTPAENYLSWEYLAP